MPQSERGTSIAAVHSDGAREQRNGGNIRFSGEMSPISELSHSPLAREMVVQLQSPRGTGSEGKQCLADRIMSLLVHGMQLPEVPHPAPSCAPGAVPTPCHLQGCPGMLKAPGASFLSGCKAPKHLRGPREHPRGLHVVAGHQLLTVWHLDSRCWFCIVLCLRLCLCLQ